MTGKAKINSLLDEAWNQRRAQNLKEAHRLTEQAQNLCKKGEFNLLGRIFHIYMQLELDQHNLDKALAYGKKSSEFYKENNDLDKVAHSTRHIADLQRKLGKINDSLQSYTEAITIYKTNAEVNTLDLANALRGYALALAKNNKIDEAISAWEEAREIYEANNIQEGIDEASSELKSLKHKN